MEHRIIIVNYYGDEISTSQKNSLATALISSGLVKSDKVSISTLNSNDIQRLVDTDVIPKEFEQEETPVKHALVYLNEKFGKSKNIVTFTLAISGDCANGCIETRNAIEILANANITPEVLAKYGMSKNHLSAIKEVNNYV